MSEKKAEIQSKLVAEQAAALARPFDVQEIKWKPQVIQGSRALVVAFIDARLVAERLDEVVTPAGWQDRYRCLRDGSVICRLKVLLGGGWVIKEDVGSQSEQPDEGDKRKAAFSDALKRAAVKYGIGRYLYRLKPQWVDYDPQKRQIVGTPRLPGQPAQKPAQAQATPPKAAKKALPADGAELVERLAVKEAEMMAEGLCAAGELLAHVREAGVYHGHGKDIQGWDETGINLAIEEVRAFAAGAARAKAARINGAAPAAPPAPAARPQATEVVSTPEYQTLARLCQEAKVDVDAFCKLYGAKGLFTFPLARYAEACAALEEAKGRVAPAPAGRGARRKGA